MLHNLLGRLSARNLLILECLHGQAKLVNGAVIEHIRMVGRYPHSWPAGTRPMLPCVPLVAIRVDSGELACTETLGLVCKAMTQRHSASRVVDW